MCKCLKAVDVRSILTKSEKMEDEFKYNKQIWKKSKQYFFLKKCTIQLLKFGNATKYIFMKIRSARNMWNWNYGSLFYW